MAKFRSTGRFTLGLLLGSLLLIAAPRVGAAQALNAVGTWASSDGNLSGAWQTNLHVDGVDPSGKINAISGTMSITGMPGLTQGNVAGSLQPGSINFGIMYDSQERAVFTGTVTWPNLAGTFTTPDGVNGQWQGQLTQMPGAASPTAPPDPTPTTVQ